VADDHFLARFFGFRKRRGKPVAARRPRAEFYRNLRLEVLERRELLSISLGAEFGGMNENYASWYPLQITAAEGPHDVVDVAGGQMAIFSQSGQFIENISMTANWTSNGNSGSGANGDNPTVVYDPADQRYVICNGVSTVYFGISKTSDPTQGWYWYTLSFPDSVDGGRFGFNASAYFVWYPSESSSSVPNTIVIQKSSILSGGTMVSYSQTAPGHPTLQVDDSLSYGSGAGDPAWFYSSTQLIKETNYLSADPTETTYNISGGTFATSKYAEIRTVNGVETMAGVDDEASLSWATNGVNSLYWSEVDVTTATVIQSGSIANPAGWADMGYAYSSLAPNGDIGITWLDATGYPLAGGGTEMAMFVTGRSASDPAGTMETPIAAFTGTYDGTRVGDYGSVNADLSNDTFWATEYTDSHPGYTGIVNFGLSNTAPAVMQPVMGLGAAPSDGTHVNLQWDAVPGATSYMILRSSNGVTFTSVATLSGSATSYTDTPGGSVSGLYYNVMAYNGQTDSAAPSVIQVTLAPTVPAYDSLSAPAGLAAVLTPSGTGIELTWSAATGAAGYSIQRATSGSTWTQIATTAAGTLQYSDSGLAGGQLYYYRISTRDSSGGQSAPSAAVTIANRPSAPSVEVNAGWPYQLQVAWNLIPAATSYTVLRSTDGVHYSAVGTTPADDTTYTDTGLTANTQYWYEVVADSTLGNSAAATATGVTAMLAPTGLAITQGTDQLALQWNAETEATSYQVERSTDDVNFTTIATLSTNSFTDTGITPLTTYYYRVTSADATMGNTSYQPSAVAFAAAPAAVALPYLWQSQDIGVSNVGAAAYNGVAGDYAVVSSGSDIGGVSDQFRFTYMPLTGDGSITALVASEQDTASNAKAGVMVRQSLNATSAYVITAVTPGAGTVFQYRTAAGNSAVAAGSSSGSAPYWVRLTRSGSTFTSQISPDGVTWTTIGTQTIAMTGTVYIGVAADSYTTTNTNTTTFSRVAVATSSSAAPTIATAAAASPGTVTGTTTNLSVLGADATGQANLYYTWTATVLSSGASQPAFSANGTNAAQDTTATFSRAGAYTLQATITNAYGLTAVSSVNVTVNQTVSGITIVPGSIILNVNAAQQFGAYDVDQFGQQMGSAISPTWSISPASGAGTLSAAGLYTAPSAQATPTITAQSGSYTATAAVQVYALDAWNNVAGGSWATAANWQNDTIAGVAGTAANFSQLALTAPATVTLDGAQTAGDLLFGDTNNEYGWTLNTGSGGPLTLSTTSGTPTIVVNNQSATVGAVLDGNQGIVKNGSGTFIQNADYDFTGGLTINSGTYELASGVGGWYVNPFGNYNQITVNAGGTLETAGVHGLGTDQNGVWIDGGALALGSGQYISALQMTGGAVSGGPLETMGGTMIFNAAATTANIASSFNLVYGSPVLNVAQGAAAVGLNVSGAIAGSDPLTKAGAGTAVFSGNNTYSGGTTVSAGTLLIENSEGSATGTGSVTVASSGTLGGTGTIYGPVTVSSGATLAPGEGGIGTLSIDNTLSLSGTTAMEISATGGTPTSDLVEGLTAVTYGGTLTVTKLGGTLAAGDVFTLFSAGAYSGSFAAINLPALGTDLAWNKAGLAVNGTVQVVGVPPTVAKPAAASPATVSGKTTNLSVLGADAAGQSNLLYTWSSSGPASVTFSVNGSNAAQNTTATCTKAGSYTFTATITNPTGASITSTVSVVVSPVATGITLSPSPAWVNLSATQQFTAAVLDQFGNALASPLTWSTTIGTIGSTGLFQAPATAGSGTVTVQCGNLSATATVTVAVLPLILSWQSVETDTGGLGQVALTISPEDGTWSEPRAGGIQELLVTFSNAISPATFTPAAVELAGNGPGGTTINLAGITVSTSLIANNTVGVIQFTPALPDAARYLVELVGVTDPSGDVLNGSNQCLMTALKGDANDDLQVTTADIAFVDLHYTNAVNPANVAQVRSDYDQNGQVNVNDLVELWNADRYDNASGIPDPVITSTNSPAGTPAAGTTIDGAAVVLASGQSLGPAGSPLAVQNGGSLDLSATSQNVGTVTVAAGTISDGSLTAAAYDLSAGTISANLGGNNAAVMKTGTGAVVLSGANGYGGVTTVLAGTLVIATASALPQGGSLVIGDAAPFASAGAALDSQQSQSAAALPMPATGLSNAASLDSAANAAAASTSSSESTVAPSADNGVAQLPDENGFAGHRAAVGGTATARISSVFPPAVTIVPTSSPALAPADRAWLAAVAQSWSEAQSQSTDDAARKHAIDVLLMTRNG